MASSQMDMEFISRIRELTSQGLDYQLLFADELPSAIFTDSKIEAKIQLVDTVSKAIVTTGALSSMKIKIVVLDGDLGFDNQENWTEQEFNAKVVRERKDKRPLLIGDLDIALRDGVGIFNDLKFTDNSSWIKCREFSLGARVVSHVRIKEAISNAFRVKDSRGKATEKHCTPSLDDEVWRLVEIGKDGKRHKRLAANGIEKVRDFRQMHTDNPEQLKDILGCSPLKWGRIVKHASAAEDSGYNCQPPAKRRCSQERLVKSQNDWAYDSTSLQAGPISTPTTGQQCPEFLVTQQSIPVAAYDHPIRPSDIICGDHNTRMERLQATFSKTTITNLDCGMTAEGPMSTRLPVSAKPSSCIQKALVESQNDGAYDLTSLQAKPISTPTTGMCMGSYHASPSSSYKVGLEDHNHLLQLRGEKNNHHIQPSDHTRGDCNIRMDGLQTTCNEETITNLDNGMTSPDPIGRGHDVRTDGLLATEETVPSLADGTTSWATTSACPVMEAPCEHTYDFVTNDCCRTGETITNLDNGMTSPDPMHRGHGIGMDGLLATEETVSSLADGTTSQAPTSAHPVTAALCEHTDDFCHPLIDDDSVPVDDVEVRLARGYFFLYYM